MGAPTRSARTKAASAARLRAQAPKRRVASLRVLKQRVWDGVADGFDFQRHFVFHPSNERLATLCIYTAGKIPEQSCQSLLIPTSAVLEPNIIKTQVATQRRPCRHPVE